MNSIIYRVGYENLSEIETPQQPQYKDDNNVRVHYLYSGHQSCELGRVTDNSGYYSRWFATVLGLV